MKYIQGGEMKSGCFYFDDRWFSSVKTAEEAMVTGVDDFGPLKTRHKGFV